MARAIALSMEAASSEQPPAASPPQDGWVCEHCTFVNSEDGATECAVCALPRRVVSRQAAAVRGTEDRATPSSEAPIITLQ